MHIFLTGKNNFSTLFSLHFPMPWKSNEKHVFEPDSYEDVKTTEFEYKFSL